MSSSHESGIIFDLRFFKIKFGACDHHDHEQIAVTFIAISSPLNHELKNGCEKDLFKRAELNKAL